MFYGALVTNKHIFLSGDDTCTKKIMPLNRYILQQLFIQSNRLVPCSFRCCLNMCRTVHSLDHRKKAPMWMRRKNKLAMETDKIEPGDGIPVIVKYLQEQRALDSDRIQDGDDLVTEEESPSPLQNIENSLKDLKFDIDALSYENEMDDDDGESESDIIELSSDTGEVTLQRSMIFGTPDPSVPVSDIPCGGCGAFLHCQDSAIPGFVPQETFKGKRKEILQTILCQRCTMMKDSDHIIHYGVDNRTYPQIIKQIKADTALIVMVVDVTDMENSIIKQFLKRVGERRPIYIVGNKIDLIPKDGPKYLERIKESLVEMCLEADLNPRDRNIKHVCLVSAKTGYGIENLITKLMHHWEMKGNVYLVGTTNSGKSTLFNTFLRSDYCKSSVRDIVQRATVSQWPGTTLNLLKFPIISPRGWRLYKRLERLKEVRLFDREEDLLRKSQLKKTNASQYAIIKESVGKTDFRTDQQILEEEEANQPTGSNFSTYKFSSGDAIESVRKRTPQDLAQAMQIVTEKDFPNCNWLFDTPGLLNENQVTTKLTADELRAVLPSNLLLPRVFLLKENTVMFLSGLARIDCLQGPHDLCVCVFTNHSLPVHIVSAAEADEFYSTHIGTDTLGVPLGDEDRLNKLPSLVGREFSIDNPVNFSTATADIQLSSLGWIALLLRIQTSCRLRVYTPGGYGIHLRQKSLLPYSYNFKGHRIRGSPRYAKRQLKG